MGERIVRREEKLHSLWELNERWRRNFRLCLLRVETHAFRLCGHFNFVVIRTNGCMCVCMCVRTNELANERYREANCVAYACVRSVPKSVFAARWLFMKAHAIVVVCALVQNVMQYENVCMSQ